MTRPRTPWTGRPRGKQPAEAPAAPDAMWLVSVEGIEGELEIQGREPARQLACHLAEKHPGKTVRFRVKP